MPLYRYECEEHGVFERIKPIAERGFCSCPQCEKQACIVVSPFSISACSDKRLKDGEGFSSVTYSKDEARYRIRNNVSKYETV